MIPFQLNLQPNIVFKSCTDFLVSDFLIFGLRNSSASCSFTLTPDSLFLSKNLLTVPANAL